MPFVRTVAVVIGIVLVGAGCSGSDDEAAPTTSTASTTTVPPRSAGCEEAPPPAGEQRVETTAEGVERWYLRRVPDGDGPWPVVVDLHGYSEGAEIHAHLSDLGSYGETEGFITVTPQGTGDPVRWDTALESADMAFLTQVLDETEAAVCVDPARVFVTGLSNGAMMTSSVACALADRVAAVAPVAGVRDPDGCDPARPMPVLAIHGTDDTFVTYEGGLGERALDLPAPDGSGRTLRDLDASELPSGQSVPEVMAAWADRGGCEIDPVEEPLTEDVDRLAFLCPAGVAVALLRVDGGGHSWPGSPLGPVIEEFVGKTTQTISANEEMWTFFQAHPLTG